MPQKEVDKKRSRVARGDGKVLSKVAYKMEWLSGVAYCMVILPTNWYNKA
jgi:hypothetical protein